MAAPELLTKVGFEKVKMGHGDKEHGYEIKDSSLSSLLGSACICFGVMAFVVIMLVYDVHLEKKTVMRQLRQDEHMAASKLAQVQMELWSEFHADIQESKEAKALLDNMQTSYNTIEPKVKAAVDELSAEFKLHPLKAAKFTDKMLHMIADIQRDNIQHAKGLVNHLVAAGKRSKTLEKHVDEQVKAQVAQEERNMKIDKKNGIDVGIHEKRPIDKEQDANKDDMDAKAQDAEDPLKELLTGFFFTFNDFETEFGDQPRKLLKEGHPVHDQIAALWKKMQETALTDEELTAELEKIDLKTVGAGLGSGRVLPVADIVEELNLISRIPHKQIRDLEKKWKSGELDSVVVFEHLQELKAKRLVPVGWLTQGVKQEEKLEEIAEQSMEA